MGACECGRGRGQGVRLATAAETAGDPQSYTHTPHCSAPRQGVPTRGLKVCNTPGILYGPCYASCVHMDASFCQATAALRCACAEQACCASKQASKPASAGKRGGNVLRHAALAWGWVLKGVGRLAKWPSCWPRCLALRLTPPGDGCSPLQAASQPRREGSAYRDSPTGSQPCSPAHLPQGAPRCRRRQLPAEPLLS